MNILVTGAGGFIGFHLVRELVDRNHRVRGLFLPEEDAGSCEALGVEIVRGDLTRPETLSGITVGVDTVFHLATRTLDWGTRKQFEAVMVDGTRNLLTAALGDIQRFIYVSSIAALGLGREQAGAGEESERIKCGIPYCDTKIAAEDLVRKTCMEADVEYTIVRPANVIGPGSVWVREILDAFLRGPFPLVGGGTAPGAFVYVDNLVDGMIRCAESSRAAGRVYHFRDDYPITWKEYLNTVGGFLGRKPWGSLPFSFAWKLGALCEKVCTPLGVRPPLTRLAVGVMGQNNEVDARRAREELGWSPSISQGQALQAIRKWVLDSYSVPEGRHVPDFHNKQVFITGGSSGIGLETAALLAGKGAHLVLIARDREKLQKAQAVVLSHCRDDHQRVAIASLDVADASVVQQEVNALVGQHGAPDILINSAGMLVSGYFEDITGQMFDRLVKINLYGTWNLVAAVLPYMKERKKGQIVILSSLAGLLGVFGYTAYCASKFALVGFAECLREETKPHGISVSVVCPPRVTSPMDQQELEVITPETRAMKKLAGTLPPAQTARVIVKGIQQKKYLIIPGFMARVMYLAGKYSPGFVSRWITDRVIAAAR